MSPIATIYEEPKEARVYLSTQHDRDDGRVLEEAAQNPLTLPACRSSGDWDDVLPEDGPPWRPLDARESLKPSLFEEARP